MAKIHKPTIEDMRPLLEEATTAANQNEAAWVKRLLAGMEATLTGDPLQYRAYGPYWWVLKREMQNAGMKLIEQAPHMDRDWAAQMDYGQTKWNLLAAWAYAEIRFEGGLFYDPEHTLADEDGEFVYFVSADEDMEMLAAAKGL